MLNEADFQGEFLKPPERALELSEIVYFILNVGGDASVERFYAKFHVRYYGFIITSMPETIMWASVESDATYWFMEPCRSANRRCMAFGDTPPNPTSFVTKIIDAPFAIRASA